MLYIINRVKRGLKEGVLWVILLFSRLEKSPKLEIGETIGCFGETILENILKNS